MIVILLLCVIYTVHWLWAARWDDVWVHANEDYRELSQGSLYQVNTYGVVTFVTSVYVRVHAHICSVLLISSMEVHVL